MDIALRSGERCKEPFEYFCKSCLQLRLSWIMCDTCGNCGSDQIIKGDLETLDKEKLINEINNKEFQREWESERQEMGRME